MSLERLPEPGTNNLWFHYTEWDAVLVFVHGVLSDSRSAWLHEDRKDPSNNRYWPALIRSDDRFQDIAIYLAGYGTALDAGSYEIQDCANEVFAGLRRRDEDGHPPVMGKTKITFVCHSMGGIVVRDLLVANYEKFKEKQVGLVLIASPSYGAKYANALGCLLAFYRHKQGEQLTLGNQYLELLDKDFDELWRQQRIPRLSGVEFFENRFIIHWKWLPSLLQPVVTRESAVRYFEAPKHIWKSDHRTICKPQSTRDSVHQFLFDFLTDNALLPTDPDSQTSPPPDSRDGGGKSLQVLLVPTDADRQTSPPPVSRNEGTESLRTLLVPTDADRQTSGPIDSRNEGGGSLQATVRAAVTIGENARHPEEQRLLDIRLRIECVNTTGLPLEMSAKYRLQVKRAWDCQASDEMGPLDTRHIHGCVEVDFTSRATKVPPTIPAGRPYAWQVGFKTSGSLLVSEDGAILSGPYVIRPLDQYKGIRIESHDFDYTFSFKKPKPEWRWLFMENYVYETNDRAVPHTRIKKRDGTDCKLARFTLRRSADRYPGDMTIYFMRIYRPRFNIRAAAALLGGIALGLAMYYAYEHGFF